MNRTRMATLLHRFQRMETPNIIRFVNTRSSEFVSSTPFLLNGLHLFIEEKNQNSHIWMTFEKNKTFLLFLNKFFTLLCRDTHNSRYLAD